MAECEILHDRLKEKLITGENGVHHSADLPRNKRAAVLICLFDGKDGELRVILTRRSMKLSSHPGDVALPGGKMDEGDADDSATALREAMEEIGLMPNLIQVVANLEPFISSNLLSVVPVVGLLSKVEEFDPTLNEDEVDAIFDAPLEMFLKEDGRHRCEEKQWGKWKYTCHLFDFESDEGRNFIIGGLTASILIQAASIIYQKSPSFNQILPDFSQLQWALNSQDLTTNMHDFLVEITDKQHKDTVDSKSCYSTLLHEI